MWRPAKYRIRSTIKSWQPVDPDSSSHLMTFLRLAQASFEGVEAVAAPASQRHVEVEALIRRAARRVLDRRTEQRPWSRRADDGVQLDRRLLVDAEPRLDEHQLVGRMRRLLQLNRAPDERFSGGRPHE